MLFTAQRSDEVPGIRQRRSRHTDPLKPPVDTRPLLRFGGDQEPGLRHAHRPAAPVDPAATQVLLQLVGLEHAAYDNLMALGHGCSSS
jgi:hypothetical protein